MRYQNGNPHDDPPWDIFGLPRLLTCEENIDRFLKMVDSPYNCLTLCSGSLNADPRNNVADIVRKHCDRIAFAHIRNVKHFPNGDFSEASHRDCDGDTGILDILKDGKSKEEREQIDRTINMASSLFRKHNGK